MQTSRLQDTLSASTVQQDLVLLMAPELVCCTSHLCISNALQTVKGHVCKLVVLHSVLHIVIAVLLVPAK